MREIEFRGWNTQTKKMLNLHTMTPLALSDTMNTQMTIMGMDGLFLPFEKDIILLQYTGIKDKNGKKIFESDLVKSIVDFGTEQYPDKHEIIETVEFCAGCFIPICEMPATEYEVIGNIYENPELI